MKMTNILHGLALSLCLNAAAQQSVTVNVKPAIVFIEKAESRQFINFDFLIKNNTADSLTLNKISVSIYDAKHQLVHSRFLDGNGTAPSIQTVPNCVFTPNDSHIVFNPLTDFSATLPISEMDFEFLFINSKEAEFKVKVIVNPKNYIQSEQYSFPLKGKVLAYDGHDYYAHHRRFDYEFAPIKQLGISANFMRYAYDFVLLDNDGKQFHGEGKDTDYFGFGQTVFSIGDGTVIYASNSHKDDKTFDIQRIAVDPLELYGNCVAIQHRDQSVSIYGHLKENSLMVKKGDQVKKGQAIAAIGISGSSFFPHLHFERRTSIENSAEGIPSYFSNIKLQEGKRESKLRSGLVETGNIIVTQ